MILLINMGECSVSIQRSFREADISVILLTVVLIVKIMNEQSRHVNTMCTAINCNATSCIF